MSKKNESLLNVMNGLDDKHIEEAEKTVFTEKRPLWRHFVSVASGVALVSAIVTFPFWGNLGSNTELTHIPSPDSEANLVWDGDNGSFVTPEQLGKKEANAEETMPEIGTPDIYPIEETDAIHWTGEPNASASHFTKTDERIALAFPFLAHQNNDYVYAQHTIDASDIEHDLGAVKLTDRDGNEANAHLYTICGVDSAYALAVSCPESGLENYFAFYRRDAEFKTFAEYKAAYSLDSMLYMGPLVSTVTKTQEYLEESIHEATDFSSLKAMIFSLDGKSCTYDDFLKNCGDGRSVGISVRHKTLFKNTKTGLQLFEDGYLLCNVGGTLQIFEVDSRAVSNILNTIETNHYGKYFSIHNQEDTPTETTYAAPSYHPDVPETTSETTSKPNFPETAYAEETTPVGGNSGATTPSYDPHQSSGTTEEIIAKETITIPD